MSNVGITLYGVCAVSFMVAMDAMERRGRQLSFSSLSRMLVIRRLWISLWGVAVRGCRADLVWNRLTSLVRRSRYGSLTRRSGPPRRALRHPRFWGTLGVRSGPRLIRRGPLAAMRV